jgi:hypothetical protein
MVGVTGKWKREGKESIVAIDMMMKDIPAGGGDIDKWQSFVSKV